MPNYKYSYGLRIFVEFKAAFESRFPFLHNPVQVHSQYVRLQSKFVLRFKGANLARKSGQLKTLVFLVSHEGIFVFVAFKTVDALVT